MKRENGSNEGGGSSFDLEERTARFGEDVVRFAKALPFTPVNIPLITLCERMKNEE